MPRRGFIAKRELLADPIYGNKQVTQFINRLMLSGKKGIAESIFYDAMGIIAAKSGKDPMEVFQTALKNVMPVLEVKPRRVGGATYQVPIEVRPERRLALAIRWLVNYASNRVAEKTMKEKLAAELLDAYQGVGSSIKKKEDSHKMAEANRAFAHYRW
jgi:small subunit ribosomal protein S7